MNCFRHTPGLVENRAALGALLAAQGLLGEAAEVGTHRGYYARQLLENWPGRLLWCVDHYPAGYDPADPASGGDRDADAAEAAAVLRPFGGRVRFLPLPSAEAAARFADGSLDMVYIDACHLYESVLADLGAWWPKVRPGGLLAGHDVFFRAHPGVTAALAAFCASRGLTAEIVAGDYRGEAQVEADSYFVRKGGPVHQ